LNDITKAASKKALKSFYMNSINIAVAKMFRVYFGNNVNPFGR